MIEKIAGKEKRKMRRYWLGMGGARIFAAGIFVVGIVASVLFSRMRYENETRRIEAAFLAQAKNAESLILREIRLFYDVLDSLGRLHSISGNIDAEDFAEFVQKGMQYQLQILGTFGLSPRVYGPARNGYEVAMRKVRGAQFSLLERTQDGKTIKAEQRPFYFPVSYVVPEKSGVFPSGLDLAANTDTRIGMERAVEDQNTTAGGYVTGDAGDRIIISPIVRPIPGVERETVSLEWIDGFAFAVLEPARLVERALQYINRDDLNVLLYDENDGKWDLIFSDAAEPVNSENKETLQYQTRLYAGGLEWLMVCMPTRDFILARRTMMPWIILSSGFLATMIVALQFVQMAGRTEKVRLLVQQRTEELSNANRLLEREIDQRHILQREIIDISTQEKRRLGQDLHDSLGQKLTGIGLLASGLARSLKEQPHASEQAKQIAELLKDARAQTRRMAKGLTPVELDAEGLPEALTKLAQDVSASGEIQCRFRQEESCPVTDGRSAVHIYHIAQEAVNNAVKHAGAGIIEVLIDGNGMRITDDGRGLNAEAAKTDGLGLKIMNYRAETVGGSLSVYSNKQKGTTVELKL